MLLKQNIWDNENLVKVLVEGGVVVMPTDTLYGIVGKANNQKVVNSIYEIRKRAPSKPCIILISDINELEKFHVDLSEEQKNKIKKFTEPTSFISDCSNDSFEYLHRGTKTLAFRLPVNHELRDLLKKTGSLIAPSANLEGMPPAENISDAKNYFGDSVDLYVDGGEIKGKASKVIRLHKDGSMEVLRH